MNRKSSPEPISSDYLETLSPEQIADLMLKAISSENIKQDNLENLAIWATGFERFLRNRQFSGYKAISIEKLYDLSISLTTISRVEDWYWDEFINSLRSELEETRKELEETKLI